MAGGGVWVEKVGLNIPYKTCFLKILLATIQKILTGKVSPSPLPPPNHINTRL